MVTLYLDSSRCLALADQAVQVGLQKLDPPTRARVIMALLGLVLLGVALVVCIMIGGRWVRRLARHPPRSTALSTSSAVLTITAPTDTTGEDLIGETLAGKNLMDDTLID